MKFKKYLLLEKTYEIRKDVELLYNKAYKKLYKIFKENELEDIPEKLKKIIKNPYSTTLLYTDSSILKSPQAKLAHDINPITIDLGIYSDGNFYRPASIVGLSRSNAKGEIQISANASVMSIMLKGKVSTISQKELVRFSNALTPDRIKLSISHELSHWLTDTLHNNVLSNIFLKAAELTKLDMVKLGKKDVNMTHFEIDGQIHGIKQLKYNNKDIWDDISLLDLFNMYTSLYTIAKQMNNYYGQDVLDIWQKSLIKRMAREKLLGKNMRKFVKPNDLW